MGFKIEELGHLKSDLATTRVDVAGSLLELAGSGRVCGAVDHGSAQDLKKSDVVALDGKVDKGNKEMNSETQPSIIQMNLFSGKRKLVPLKPLRSWSAVVEGNRDIGKGWDLQYVKPHDPTGAVVITEDEWVTRSKIWENALVGYVLRFKPAFKDMANFLNNRWKEFQVLKVFVLRNGVFLFDFSDGDAKQAVLEKRWTFNEHPLILKQWTPDFDLDNLDISKIPPMRCGTCRNLGHEERKCTAKAKKVWVSKKLVEEQVVKQVVSSRTLVGNDEVQDTMMQTVDNSANVKQSTLLQPSGKMILKSNGQCLVQSGLEVMSLVNLQNETGTSTSDKEMMQNVAGGTPSVDVKKFMISNKVQFLALLETRVKEENNNRVVQKLGSQWGWLNNYYSHCNVEGVKFLCTIVYAFNSFDGRVALWEKLRALDVASVPWIIFGDFNTTLHYGERVKLSGVVWGDTSKLFHFVSSMEVIDLQFSGAFFTCCNKQVENHRLWCKLDRVMANSSWVSAFPNTSVVFLNPQSSDHSPSLVTVDLLMNNKP
ncbi:hypothetical protein SLEP1_g47845 [Rubroshorea leprosula]|uniref:DUF4283 domain-containing protein n=1 Tax=Rubroshorea leprosula TaxID=152421 RepID=A0AAV5LRW1_9ROSI|nr:hypothetical protein SLEP1_g47845 [Rubroshorea leprosula]